MNVLRILVGLALGVAVLCAGVPATAQVSATATPPPKDGFLGAIVKSLTGDVYAQPERWRPLSFSGFFTEGWDQAWVSPPAGGGGAPRQGWLNAFDGVFYRLGIATYGYAHNFVDNGNQNSGLLQFYLPFNQRFEFRVDIPAAVSNKGATGNDYETNFGDFTLVPRVILSETQNLTQSFNVAFRMPTGDTSNLNGVAAITPTYEFWTNWWKGLVLRGGAGFFVPYGHQSIDKVGARASFVANFAFGYYFTPHDLTPFGDLVFYLSTNLVQTIDNHDIRSTNTVSLTPGFRTHLGRDWYFLGAVEVPVAHVKPFDYQVLGAIMKVF
jgi:hypothetical protein